jgi:hypothetical protein
MQWLDYNNERAVFSMWPVSETRFRTESVDSQVVKRRVGGWCEMAAELLVAARVLS